MNIESILFVIIFSIFVISLTIIYYWFEKLQQNYEEKQIKPIETNDCITLSETFSKIKENYGSHKAISFEKNGKMNHIYYRDYYNSCCSFSRKLLYFIGKSPNVGMIGCNTPEWFYSMIGTIMAGGSFNAMDHDISNDYLEKQIIDSKFDILIVDTIGKIDKISDLHSKASRNIKNSNVRIILHIDSVNETLDKYIESMEKKMCVKIIPYNVFINTSLSTCNTKARIEIVNREENNRALIVHTKSGKDIAISEKDIYRSLRKINNTIRKHSKINLFVGERFFSLIAVDNISSIIMNCFLPILIVGNVYLCGNIKSIEKKMEIIRNVEPSVIMGSPDDWRQMRDYIKKYHNLNPDHIVDYMLVNNIVVKKLGFNRLKYPITTNGKIDKDIYDFFDQIHLTLCNIYSVPEANGPISLCFPGYTKGVGLPIANIKISDNSEILVKGRTRGSKWIGTGDYGFIDRDGSLYINEEEIEKKSNFGEKMNKSSDN
jgi:long-subunit acyl-CoA synthetase (AMP-forming)